MWLFDSFIYAILFYEGYRLNYYTVGTMNPAYWNSKKAKQSSAFREHLELDQRLKTGKQMLLI